MFHSNATQNVYFSNESTSIILLKQFIKKCKQKYTSSENIFKYGLGSNNRYFIFHHHHRLHDLKYRELRKQSLKTAAPDITVPISIVPDSVGEFNSSEHRRQPTSHHASQLQLPSIAIFLLLVSSCLTHAQPPTSEYPIKYCFICI